MNYLRNSHRDACCISTNLLISYDAPRWLSLLSHRHCPPLLYILEIFKQNYMQFYLIISNFYSSFVFIFSPPSPSESGQSGTKARIVRRGGDTFNNNITHGLRGGRRWFFILPFLTHPPIAFATAKRMLSLLSPLCWRWRTWMLSAYPPFLPSPPSTSISP